MQPKTYLIHCNL